MNHTFVAKVFLGSTHDAGSPTQLAASEVDQVLSLFGHLESNNIPELNNQPTVFRWSYILTYLTINIITVHLTGKQQDLQQVIMVHLSMVAGLHMKLNAKLRSQEARLYRARVL